jgi:hypothetical protein
MALVYGKSSPRDVLAKAERDLARLEKAELSQAEDAMSDALFDLAVALTSLKDWLKEHPGTSFTPALVESYVANSVALSSFRDIANGGKHRVIRKYRPETEDVTSSAGVSVSIAMIDPRSGRKKPAPRPASRLKIIRTDRSRHRATELGHAAISEWRAFMAQHSVQLS